METLQVAQRCFHLPEYYVALWKLKKDKLPYTARAFGESTAGLLVFRFSLGDGVSSPLAN